MIVPEDADTCRIINCANGEYMATGDDGYLVRWKYGDQTGQRFSFVNKSGDWWNIQTGDGRYATIVLPWGPGVAKLNTQPLLRDAGDKKYQQFQLVPVDEQKRPTLEKGDYDPGQIPEIPRLTGFDRHPPERSPFYLIGETILPATIVRDPGLPDMVHRVETNPYYILRREQYWDRTQCSGGDPCLYEHDGHTTKHYETEISYGYSKSQSREMADMTSTKLSAEGKIVFGPKVNVTISGSIQHDLKVQQATSSEYKESIREKATLDIPAERFIVCNWVLVNRYTMLNMQRETVNRWETCVNTACLYPMDIRGRWNRTDIFACLEVDKTPYWKKNHRLHRFHRFKKLTQSTPREQSRQARKLLRPLLLGELCVSFFLLNLRNLCNPWFLLLTLPRRRLV